MIVLQRIKLKRNLAGGGGGWGVLVGGGIESDFFLLKIQI